jgi:hypothetical protein
MPKAKSSSSSCLGLVLLLCCLGFFALNWLFEAGRISHRASEQKVFPGGEILTGDSWVSSGWRGSDFDNQLYFQKTDSSPQEKLGGTLRGDWRSHTLPINRAKLVRAKGFLLLVVVGTHIFQHSILKGKSDWLEITWMPDEGAVAFLGSFAEPHDPPLAVETVQPNLAYAFDHIDVDQNLLITKRVIPDDRLPLYLVYSSVTYNQPAVKPPGILDEFDWNFDLERTRIINGLMPPKDPNITVDVSVRAWPNPSESMSNISGETFGGKELYRKSFPASSTQWTSIDYSAINLDNEIPKQVAKHAEFRFGFQDVAADTYTFSWRGRDLYGTQYPSAKPGQWTWASSGGSVESELVFFRIRIN